MSWARGYRIAVVSLTFMGLTGFSGCKKTPPQVRVEAKPRKTPPARVTAKTASSLPASTFLAFRDRLFDGDHGPQKASGLGFGILAKSLLFKLLEMELSRGADSTGLRAGGDLVLAASADRTALRLLLSEGQKRLRSAHSSQKPLAALYQGMGTVVVQVQLTFPVKDTGAFLKRVSGLKILNGPDVLRWIKGGTPEAAMPAKLKLFAPLKPALLVRAGAGWVVACWSLPTKRQVFCRVGYPLLPPDGKSYHVASLAAQWRVGEPPMAKRLQARIFGKEPVAALLDAEGLALVADILSLPDATQHLQRVAAKDRRETGAGYARLVGMGSRLVDTDSQLFRTCYWTFEPMGASWRITQGWPLTKRGLEVFTPIVKLARGYNILESQHWKHRFWRPLRQRLDTLYPLQGYYLLPQKEYQRISHSRHLSTLIPLLAVARIWPDVGRSKGPLMSFDDYSEILKQNGTESLRVDIQGGDLLWIMRRSQRTGAKPSTTPPAQGRP